MTHQLIKTPDTAQEAPMAEMLRLMQEIHAQNVQLLNRIDTLEREQARKAIALGFGGGMAGGGIVSVGIELIRAKFGG